MCCLVVFCRIVAPTTMKAHLNVSIRVANWLASKGLIKADHMLTRLPVYYEWIKVMSSQVRVGAS